MTIDLFLFVKSEYNDSVNTEFNEAKFKNAVRQLRFADA